MKICGISDIHGNLIDIPKCDVLCICGDIMPLSVQRDPSKSRKWFTNNFLNWANKLPCEKVILVPGNHDFYFEKVYNAGNWSKAKKIILGVTSNKVEMLIDELYIYNGIKFYGTPWIQPIDFQQGKWAFERSSCEIEDSIYWEIPKCDILLTHDNPNFNSSLGYCCFGQYKYHLFGHWHDGIAYKHLGQYNCSILDDMYNHKKNLEIVTIDIMDSLDTTKVEQEFLKTLIFCAKTDEVSDFLKSFQIDSFTEDEDDVEWDTSGSFCSDYDEEADDYKSDSDEELKEAA